MGELLFNRYRVSVLQDESSRDLFQYNVNIFNANELYTYPGKFHVMCFLSQFKKILFKRKRQFKRKHKCTIHKRCLPNS